MEIMEEMGYQSISAATALYLLAHGQVDVA